MKKRSIVVLVLMMIFSTYTVNAFIFNDIDNHWAEEAIYQVSFDVPVFSGYPDGTFRPDHSITRAEFVVMINKIINLNGLKSEFSISDADYYDLPVNHWAYKSVQNVHQQMFATKEDALALKTVFPGEFFYPNIPITRLEVALLTHGLTTPPISNSADIHFIDVNAADPHANQLSELAASGIISGYEDGTFRPDNLITRAEAAVLAEKIYHNLSYLKIDRLSIAYPENNRQLGYPVLDIPLNRSQYDELDRKMNNIIATLEYRDIVGFIPFDERDLYDPDPIETLWTLKNQDYQRVLANNFYLMVYDQSINPLRRVELATEALQKYMGMNPSDVNDFLLLAYEIQNEAPDTLFIDALQRHRRSELSRQEKIESTILLSEKLLNQNRLTEAAELYPPLIQSETDIPTLLILIQNDVFISFIDKGTGYALDRLDNYWEQLKEHSRYWFFESEVEEHLTGLAKQIILQSQ
ncbi:S-layer homology domain-containing protein [Anoxynatronum buryatiense]|uniref:S-layer homology domain-containing protein n=1 Tax=Anoxynatronum buryatiense TaxID=489973 RepID=A0AA46AIK8_9CLOT|nr:S-layer homology domain-containing protein [Anoxynatronum buryatiense]SMP49921.1 S-layer homology domain-containing protein [Anoxynatronum buryatiense]